MNNYWRGRPSAWNRPLPGARPGAVRPAVRPLPGVRGDIGFRPATREIRPPSSVNIYNRLPARTRDVPRAPSQLERARPAVGRPNNVYADRNGDVYRRTQQGWQQREAGGWRTLGSSGKTQSKVPASPGVVTRPVPGTTMIRPAPRPELDRDFSARQRGETRVRERSRDFSRATGGSQTSTSRPTQSVHPGPQPKGSGERRGGGDKEKRH